MVDLIDGLSDGDGFSGGDGFSLGDGFIVGDGFQDGFHFDVLILFYFILTTVPARQWMFDYSIHSFELLAGATGRRKTGLLVDGGLFQSFSSEGAC